MESTWNIGGKKSPKWVRSQPKHIPCGIGGQGKDLLPMVMPGLPRVMLGLPRVIVVLIMVKAPEMLNMLRLPVVLVWLRWTLETFPMATSNRLTTTATVKWCHLNHYQYPMQSP